MIKVIFEKEMNQICMPGSVICLEVIESIMAEDGSIIVKADACAFTAKATQHHENKTPENNKTINPIVLDPIINDEDLNKDDILDHVISENNYEIKEEVKFEVAKDIVENLIENDSVNKISSQIGDIFDLTSISSEVEISEEKISQEQVIEEKINNDVISNEKITQNDSVVETIEEKQNTKEVSLFGERGPSLFGVEENKVNVENKQENKINTSFQSKEIETITTKERFYEVLNSIDTSSVKNNNSSGSEKLSREQAISAESEGKIRTGFIAYVKNKAKGRLVINDMKTSVSYNDILNLGSISADKLKGSADLYELISSGSLEFVSSEQAKEIREKAMKKNASFADKFDDDVEEEAELKARKHNKKNKARKIKKYYDSDYYNNDDDGDYYNNNDDDDGDYYNNDEDYYNDDKHVDKSERVSVNMVPKRLRKAEIYVKPDPMNELDKVQVDIGLSEERSL